ncbi:MAG: ExbD/TolR family protein [Arenicella sp.]
MNFSEQEHREESLIELTPLIDVVFLLLIFFMVTTTFTKESELKINLPESSQNQENTQKPKMMEVYVTQGSGYAIKGPNDDAPISLVNSARETLVRAFNDYRSNDNSLLLVIRADKLATHESVVQVMDVAQKVGLTRITFATQKTAE